MPGGGFEPEAAGSERGRQPVGRGRGGAPRRGANGRVQVNSRQASEHSRLSARLRVALVAGLVAAAWSVYRSLPPGGGTGEGGGQNGATALRIVLRRRPDAAAKHVPVQLYCINMTAARSEFDSGKRPGVRFEDFA